MSERLTLEFLTVTHAPELASSLSDAAVYEVIGGSPRSEAEWRNLLRVWERRLSPDGRQTWLNWAIRLLPLGPVVGYVQATVEHGEAQIAYVVGTPWQRKGYAVEAVRAQVDVSKADFMRIVPEPQTARGDNAILPAVDDKAVQVLVAP